MTLINYIRNNDVIFFSMYAGVAGLIGYKFLKSFAVNPLYVDKGIQTDAWENYSSISSPIAQTDASSVTTVLPIPPQNLEVLPNPDISLITKDLVDTGTQTIKNPFYGKDWNTIIEEINNTPSFYFDSPGCDSWIIPDPSVLTILANSEVINNLSNLF